ncbi:MAG: NAD(P)H-dependent oxidoreductase [Nitrosopumilaceae archaeon]|jgi:FMN reductase
MTIKILGVGSSMREDSFSTAALKIALDFSKHQGAETTLLDLKQTQLPMFYSQKQKTKEVQEVTNHVKWADAFLLATPDYHGSMSGSMKNFLDYFWSDFAGKLFGYMCASHEKGLTVMDQMRTAIRQCYGWSLPYGVSINGDDDFENGQITNQKLNSRLEMLSGDIVVYGELLRDQFLKDLKGTSPNTFASHYRN